MRKINQYSTSKDKILFIIDYLLKQKCDIAAYQTGQGYDATIIKEAIKYLVDLGFEQCLHYNKGLQLYECDFYNKDIPGHGLAKDKDYHRCICEAIIEAIYRWNKYQRLLAKGRKSINGNKMPDRN